MKSISLTVHDHGAFCGTKLVQLTSYRTVISAGALIMLSTLGRKAEIRYYPASFVTILEIP